MADKEAPEPTIGVSPYDGRTWDGKKWSGPPVTAVPMSPGLRMMRAVVMAVLAVFCAVVALGGQAIWGAGLGALVALGGTALGVVLAAVAFTSAVSK